MNLIKIFFFFYFLVFKMSYIVDFERRYTQNESHFIETINILENKYDFPLYINIKEIVSGFTNVLNHSADGILFICKDSFCLTDNFLDNLKYTSETNTNKKKYYYSDYSLCKIPLKSCYDKYTFDNFKVLLYPGQKLSVCIYFNTDNQGNYAFYASGWIKFQVERYPN